MYANSQRQKRCSVLQQERKTSSSIGWVPILDGAHRRNHVNIKINIELCGLGATSTFNRQSSGSLPNQQDSEFSDDGQKRRPCSVGVEGVSSKRFPAHCFNVLGNGSCARL